jgi:hypothetical protein
VIRLLTPARVLFRWSQPGRPSRYCEVFAAADPLELVEQGMRAVERLGLQPAYPLRLTVLHLKGYAAQPDYETRPLWLPPRKTEGAQTPDAGQHTQTPDAGQHTQTPDAGQHVWDNWPHETGALRSLLGERAPELFELACLALTQPRGIDS